MEHIVYLLGAGFSAPLGLPVMRTFLMRSKDMYAAEPDRYSHFQKVFECINELSRIHSYFDTDLFNIEEILSILEMRDQIGGKSTARRFVKYIADVIEHCTLRLPVGLTHRQIGTSIPYKARSAGSRISILS